MENNVVIEVKNLGKKYNISHQNSRNSNLRDVMSDILSSPFKFFSSKLKNFIGRDNNEDFWALRNVNFSINQGETVGIIGSNGSGKSTFLKIISRITTPTEGEVFLNGRVGSLLEVGTGFHEELTGLENVYLNGAILGMRKKEISAKLDEIIKFSEVEKFIDMPIKYYSSGMRVKLAFSIAIHMEPDILIVDEVLAVGDAAFREKCLKKIKEISSNGKCTILFVSHDMDIVKNLCQRCLLLKNGQIEKIGTTKEVVDFYIDDMVKFYYN